MKIACTFTKKSPGPEEYSSQGFHLTIESEPPAEIAQDREKLRLYVEELFAECRARVDDQVAAARPSPVSEEPRRTVGALSRRAPGRTALRATTRREPAPAPAGNGHAANGTTELASPKQVNYLRSLASQAGLSYGQVSALAEENFGKKDLRELTKREASILIDELRGGPA